MLTVSDEHVYVGREWAAMIGVPPDESVRDVISDDLVRRVAAEVDVDCDHQVCWVRAVVEVVAPVLAADEVLLRRVRAVGEGGG